MRKLLFNLVSAASAGLIFTIQGVGGFLITMTGKIGQFLLRLIDGDRLQWYESLLDASEAPNELEQQNLELTLLQSAQKVRDHAKENEWTEQHTDAMSAVGDALIAEFGWEEESVHQYLKELVESIDGLQYGE